MLKMFILHMTPNPLEGMIFIFRYQMQKQSSQYFLLTGMYEETNTIQFFQNS